MSVPLSITLTILLGSVLLAASSSVTPISTIAVAPAARDICSSDETGFKKGSAEAGVACYVGNFLVEAMTELNQGSEKTAEHVKAVTELNQGSEKTAEHVKAMTELNQGSEKTAEHVRIHMLPYLGGYKGIDALLHENIHNEKCQICFMSDYGTASGLRSLRLSLTDDQLAVYDGQKPCFHTLANHIMSLMPHHPLHEPCQLTTRVTTHHPASNPNTNVGIRYRLSLTDGQLVALSLTDDQLAAYDSQKPCFHTLANRIMSLMPTDREGLFLLPSDGAKPDAADNAFDDTVDLLKDLFDNDKYDAASCVKNPSSS
eukprot:gene31373-6532_t